jgi:hypothetical protein
VCLLSDVYCYTFHILHQWWNIVHLLASQHVFCFTSSLRVPEQRTRELVVHTSTVLQQVLLAHGHCILSSSASLRAYGGVAFLHFCYLNPDRNICIFPSDGSYHGMGFISSVYLRFATSFASGDLSSPLFFFQASACLFFHILFSSRRIGKTLWRWAS